MRLTKKVLVLLSALILVVPFASCSCSRTAAQEVFAGELVDAQGSRVVVRGTDETMLFETNDATEYDLKDEDELCVGDQIEVSYEKNDTSYIAETVKLTSHVEKSEVYGGELTELGDTYLTVQSESLTVVFNYDDETKLEGNISEADSVIVTYEGDLSANPRAISVVVVRENAEKAEKSLHGTVSEISDGSVVISVDSAHACRIAINKDTKFSGDDTKLKIGDEVHIVYKGDATEAPAAISVKVTRNEKQQWFVMDGVIEKASKDSLVLRTAKKAYTFKIVKETRIQNPDYMKEGHKSTVTYVVDPDKKLTAASIFCSKDTVTEKEKEQAAESSTITVIDNKEADNVAKDDSITSKVDAEGTEKAAETEKSKSADKNADASNGEEVTEQEPEATEPETVEPEATEQEPEATEPEATEQEPEATEPEATEQEPEAAEPEATEQEPEAAEPEEAEPEKKPVVIKTKGVIQKWAKECEIKIEGKATLKLDISDASVSGGYIPKEGDEVEISYDKDEMKLLKIKLEYRPVDGTAEGTVDDTAEDTEQ